MCKERCTGYHPHSWRKLCVACGCSAIDHTVGSDMQDDWQMGRLLTDSPCCHMTAKVKGGGGLRLYKRNRMIVTNSVLSGKDPTFSTTTYDWAPPGLTQNLAMQYMDLLPVDRRPVSGTEGSLYRRRQIQKQLPIYDQDPMQCCSLSTEEEISSMLLFVRSYKQEVLGLGEVALPGEGGALREAANQRRAKEAKDHGSSNSKGGMKHQDLSPANGSTAASAGSTNGTQDSTKTKVTYLCTGCHGEVAMDTPVVYAERAGYHSAMWHPSCFLCSECGQGLVDLVYFWSNQKLLCGRHYCQTVWPRCGGCDELIFCQSYHTGTDGQMWHHDHYCCWLCGQSLDTPCGCQR
ncbi:LIM and cysteine-rich domains protein 1 [Lampris incognitus]|uniref:LIM and cysteine-rich domains protein 1 n=1 Tax=Lampris incognitus TaxID=2546036 RepID=UPI0024B58A20|nr:LIM and cysteine-rich domains protein 1 [Lampris incognitus]